jgi:ubiquitin-protein ligase
MTAHATRREQDVIKLKTLATESGGKIRVVGVSGSPPSSVDVEINLPTAGDKTYPRNIQKSTRLVIELGSRYPFVEPRVVIKTPILHPNVYSSGQVCLGAKWLPTQGLDLLVKRLIQIVTYDLSILNEKSPANRDALNWFASAQRDSPSAFPTTRDTSLSAPKGSSISWNNKK